MMARAEQFGSKGGQIANEWRSRVRGGGSAQPARHPDEGLTAAGAVGGEDDGAVALVLVDEARVRKVGEQRGLPLDAAVRDLAHLVRVEAVPLSEVELLVEGEDVRRAQEVDEGVADVAAAQRSGAVRRVSGEARARGRGGRGGEARGRGGGRRGAHRFLKSIGR